MVLCTTGVYLCYTCECTCVYRMGVYMRVSYVSVHACIVCECTCMYHMWVYMRVSYVSVHASIICECTCVHHMWVYMRVSHVSVHACIICECTCVYRVPAFALHYMRNSFMLNNHQPAGRSTVAAWIWKIKHGNCFCHTFWSYFYACHVDPIFHATVSNCEGWILLTLSFRQVLYCFTIWNHKW